MFWNRETENRTFFSAVELKVSEIKFETEFNTQDEKIKIQLLLISPDGRIKNKFFKRWKKAFVFSIKSHQKAS